MPRYISPITGHLGKIGKERQAHVPRYISALTGLADLYCTDYKSALTGEHV